MASAMANSGLAQELRAIPIRIPDWLVEAAFFGVLLIVFLGHAPFSPPAPVLREGGTNPTGAGDVLRQACYLSMFALIVLGALQKRGLAILHTVPPLLALLIAWCIFSAGWAQEGAVAFRRAVLEMVLVISIMLGTDFVGSSRSLAFWRLLLATILFVNFLSIPLIATAVHGAGEQDPSLVGDWRGLFAHKNVAGAVSALTAILFLFPAIEERRWDYGLVAVLAVIFLVMTHSKSSLGLLPVALLVGSSYRLAWKRPIDRAILCLVVALFLAIGVAALAAESSSITKLLEDPAEFSGRAQIWQAEYAYIVDHPLLGSGFGTFAEAGGTSPLRAYISGDWVTAVSHGHSGYLQLFVTIGAIGFLLALASMVLQPLRYFWPIDPRTLLLRATLLSVFAFVVLHNAMESDFLADDGAVGVTLLFAIAVLGTRGRESLTAHD
jgi:exopolysaccharide production protein ExoQ